MGKSFKSKPTSTLAPTNLEANVVHALQAGHAKQAVEWAKQLCKQEPTPEHQRLLRDAYQERARQMHRQGMSREAIGVLENALALEAEPAWRAAAAEEMAAYGHPARALELLGGLPEMPTDTPVLGRLVDQIISQDGPAPPLPADLQSQCDLVRTLLADLEAGRDDAVRAALQQIGVRSPALEWKLLARGLLAYYEGDDARALENWQRLDSHRLPFRLATPLRFQIDPEFRRVQSPEAQAQMRKRADRLLGNPLLAPLRALQKALADTEQVREALTLAGQVVPLLRDQPAALRRLASCMFWYLVEGGGPDDVRRYGKLFGAPPEDPGLDRLSALCAEVDGGMEMAHIHWQRFEQAVAKRPDLWHGQADRARALVWLRMGQNAAQMPSEEVLENLPPFLRDHPDRPRPLTPSAQKCFERSLQLAPNLLAAHEALIDFWKRQEQPKQEEAAVRRLLEQCPGQAKTLERLADLLVKRREFAEAVRCYQQALQANPLETGLRGKLSSAYLGQARGHAEAKEFEAARASYRAALRVKDGADYSVFCKWAACEFRAGQEEQAENLIRQAHECSPIRLVVSYLMVVEASRLKLPRPLIKRFEGEWQAGLAQPLTEKDIVELARAAAVHRMAAVEYRGQKTHEKKILTVVEKIFKLPYTRGQAEAMGAALLALDASRLLRQFLSRARSRFPDNPRLWLLEAEQYFRKGPQGCPPHIVLPLLDQAARLAARLPAGDEQRKLLEDIGERQRLLQSTTGLMDELADLLGGFPDDDFADPDDDEAFAPFGLPLPLPRRRRRR
jgi:tetratricopeptide (TPR) repeat protein